MRIGVVGGGIAGTTAALLAARVGHDVVVLDRDADVGDTPTEAWEFWDRRGVPQFRQLHGYQALATQVLRNRLPDVVERLHEAGAHEADLTDAVPSARAVPGSEDLVQVRCRRSTLEWVLRRMVAAEPAVELRAGVEVIGLLGDRGRVDGVRTSSGDVRVDLVVDAGGRRSQYGRWCAAAGLPAPETESVPAEHAYYTRWFRHAVSNPPPQFRVDLTFAGIMIFPVDARWTSVTVFGPAGDPAMRAALGDPDRFVAAVRTVAPVAAALDGASAEPHGGVLFMGGLANALTRSTGPVARLADAVACTSPTWGRGVALALDNAGVLADALAAEQSDPAAVAERCNLEGLARLEPWFHDTVRLDAEVNALWHGRPAPDVDPAHFDVVAAARVDPVVWVAYMRYRNLLDRPEALWDNAELMGRVRAAVAAGAPSAVLSEPDKATFSRV